MPPFFYCFPLTFRFQDLLWIPRAELEVEALLDHLFEHNNTAVFVAYRLLQRLITSNPVSFCLPLFSSE